jgi:hypothetical protein
MSDQKQRDPLDKGITRTLRKARRPRSLPQPGSREPSDDELLRFVEGLAGADERSLVEEAQGRSAYTRERIETLREALAESGEGPTLVERAARYVFVMARDAFELLRGSTAPLVLTPAATRTRSGSHPVSPGADSAAAPRPCYFEFTQPFHDLDAHLKIEHVSRARSAPTIDVQIRLVAQGVPATDARVTLVRHGKTLDSIKVERDGAATFSGLEQDRYELDVSRGGKVVGRVHLDFIGQA